MMRPWCDRLAGAGRLRALLLVLFISASQGQALACYVQPDYRTIFFEREDIGGVDGEVIVDVTIEAFATLPDYRTIAVASINKMIKGSIAGSHVGIVWTPLSCERVGDVGDRGLVIGRLVPTLYGQEIVPVSERFSDRYRRRAAAQRPLPKGFVVDIRKFVDSCPPGHRIAFQFGEAWLYVAPHWLKSPSLERLATRFENQCPVEPVVQAGESANPLYFNRSIFADAQATPTSLGGSSFQLTVTFDQRKDKPVPGASREPVQQPAVVDVPPPLSDWSNSQRPPRIYDLRYPDDGTGSSTTIRVSCHGGGPGTYGKRLCFTRIFDVPYRYRGTLRVDYVLAQAHSSATEEVTPAYMEEGERILAFDLRIRGWIDSMMKTP